MTKTQIKVLTILFSDGVGSLAKKQGTGDPTYNEQRRRVEGHVRQIIERKDDGKFGEVVKFMGDEVMAVFELPTVAVERALEIQSYIYGRNQSLVGDDPEFSMKIGINMGEITIEITGDKKDYQGTSVDVAKRVQAYASSGEICVTESVYDSASTYLRAQQNAGRIRWEELRPRKIRGLDRTKRLYKVSNVFEKVVRPALAKAPELPSGRAQRPKREEILKRIGAAKARMQRNELTRAINEFSRLLRRRGLERVAVRAIYGELGVALYLDKQYEVLEERMREALSKFSNDVRFLNLLGLAYMRRASYAQAREVFIKALRLRPSNVGLKVNFAMWHWEMRHPEEAIRITKEAYREKPDYTVGVNNLAYYLAERGRHYDLTKAERLSKLNLRLDPSNTVRLNTRGFVKLKQGKLDEAQALAESSHQKNPMDNYTCLLLARIFKAKGDVQGAKNFLRRIVEAEKFPTRLLLDAQAELTDL